ncbi:MAG TPA: hypothetical protein VLE72_02795 [Candidatus Saccharimonadales bacterium]|nr:hypothetical protein [Candidatus Saccharimonadales bacterium]
MPTDLKTIRLPERDDMLQRLTGVMDDPHAVERFYPLILRSAGRELNGMGVVNMVALAIEDYCNGMPPVVKSAVYMNLRRYVTALIDDDVVRADAFALLDEVNAERGQEAL